jgi:hypothetical protein
MDEWNAIVEKCQIVQLSLKIDAAEQTFRKRTAESVRRCFHISRQLDYLRKQAESHVAHRVFDGATHKHDHRVEYVLEKTRHDFATNKQAVLDYIPRLQGILVSNLAAFEERAQRLLLRIDDFVHKDNNGFNYTNEQFEVETFVHNFPEITGSEPFESDQEVEAVDVEAAVEAYVVAPVEAAGEAVEVAPVEAAGEVVVVDTRLANRQKRIEAECAPLRGNVQARWWALRAEAAAEIAERDARRRAELAARIEAECAPLRVQKKVHFQPVPPVVPPQPVPPGVPPVQAREERPPKRSKTTVYPLVFAGGAALVNQPRRAGNLYETQAPGTGSLLVLRGSQFAVFDLQQSLTLRSRSR